jgi:predicted nucleic acid-binding protein
VRVYADSSALIKRAISEQHSLRLTARLQDFVDSGAELFSSQLAIVEVSRTIRSRFEDLDPEVWNIHIEQAMSGVDQVKLAPEIIDLAARIGASTLRTLDAIHVASAFVTSCDVFVTYDTVQARFCRELGMAVVSPE